CDWDMHAGISSGAIIAGALKDSVHPALLASGEPIELARRFCALNHRYGSKILIDTPTFDSASETVVARPIDFVSGTNSHDRLEIYEPLWLATEAKPEHVARRNSFWSGVVLYREKRWAEAYSEFQKARGPEGEEDPALQFYLRRLEPLFLQVTGSPLEKSGARFEEDGISGRNPEFDCATTTNAGSGSSLCGTDCALDGASTERSAGANLARYRGNPPGDSFLQTVRIFFCRRNMRDLRRFLALDRTALHRREPTRNFSFGENQCLSGTIPFSWREDFSTRSYWPRRFAH